MNSMKSECGSSLFEAVVASLLFLIVISGLLPLLAMTMRGEGANDLYTQAASAARSKMEEIKDLSYVEIGICADRANCPDVSPGNGPSLNNTTGMGYIETDPYGDDRFTIGPDHLLSDNVSLKLGNKPINAIRKVTVQAVDDNTDGLGGSDNDGLIDSNTQTVIDYKLVTVTIVFTDPILNETISQSYSTIISGLGGDDDTNAGSTKPKGGVKQPPSQGSPGAVNQPVSKSRKGRYAISPWTNN